MSGNAGSMSRCFMRGFPFGCSRARLGRGEDGAPGKLVSRRSGEDRRRFGDPLGSALREALESRLEALMDHARADVGPARGLMLLGEDLVAVVELAAKIGRA